MSRHNSSILVFHYICGLDLPYAKSVSYTHLDVYKRQYAFGTKYNIENNIKLIEKLENIRINVNTKLISLDVKDMFTNITVNKVIKLIKDNNMGEYRYKKQLMKVIKECVNQNYFRFNNRFYIQKKGLPMGSSLSPLFIILAEIYMNDFEKQLINSTKYKDNIKLWSRYVAVSYTHLDVYKRQVAHHYIKIFRLALSSFTAHHQIGNEPLT